MGMEAWKYQERAKFALEQNQSKWIERQLWEDELGLGGPALATSGAVVVNTAGAVDPSAGLRLLEEAAGDCSVGGEVMIHGRAYAIGGMAEKGMVRMATENDAVYEAGRPKMVDYMGSLVVPGRGYTGSGPNGEQPGATEWLYATGIVTVRLGEVFYTPDTLAQATDRSTNTVTYYAERAAAVAFDPDCCVLAVEVTR
jgi:hypothetical protein